MKNIASILLLVLIFNFTAQAQKKRGYKQQLTINQQTSLKVKQMTLVLDLSDKQQQQVTPFLRTAIAFKQAAMEKRKKKKEKKKKTYFRRSLCNKKSTIRQSDCSEEGHERYFKCNSV